jgi:hypothetical protein
MSYPARDPRSGIDGKANGASGRYANVCIEAVVSEAAA